MPPPTPHATACIAECYHAPLPFVQAALTDRLLKLPFTKGFADVYHKLHGWRAKRQHLSMFAPHFSYEVRVRARARARARLLVCVCVCVRVRVRACVACAHARALGAHNRSARMAGDTACLQR